MKNIILSVLILSVILVLTNATTTKKVENKASTKKNVVNKVVTKCPPSCRCDPTKNLVCGVSGRTHVNACIAGCFKDKVKHHGPCKVKCDRATKTKKTSLKWEQYGKCTRKRSCKWVHYCKQGVCTEKDKRCQWVGDVKCSKLESQCFWENRSKDRLQEKCCVWTRSCLGKNCSNSAKKCEWNGNVIITTPVNGCKWKITGQNSRRRYCCQSTEKCHHKFEGVKSVSKKCEKGKEICRYVGPTYKKLVTTKCNFETIGPNQKREKCCAIERSCVDDVCTEKPYVKVGCQFKGVVIHTTTTKECKDEKYGQNGLRKKMLYFQKRM